MGKFQWEYPVCMARDHRREWLGSRGDELRSSRETPLQIQIRSSEICPWIFISSREISCIPVAGILFNLNSSEYREKPGEVPLGTLFAGWTETSLSTPQVLSCLIWLLLYIHCKPDWIHNSQHPSRLHTLWEIRPFLRHNLAQTLWLVRNYYWHWWLKKN